MLLKYLIWEKDWVESFNVEKSDHDIPISYKVCSPEKRKKS